MTKKNKNKLIGITSTVVFHTIAIVLMFVLCFKTPLPLPGEAGVEVNLGMYETMSQQDYETTSQQDYETTSQQDYETTSQEEDITFEDEEVPAIEEETEEVEEDTVEEVKEEKPVVNQRAMFKAPVSNASEDKNEDKEAGNPNGLKDINRYEGHGGSGDGPSYDLGGRGAKSISSPSKDFDEEGTVVIDIWVDKEGRVQRVETGKGTTTTNSNMLESAKRAALNSIFDKDDKAADLQKGSITYTFIKRQ